MSVARGDSCAPGSDGHPFVLAGPAADGVPVHDNTAAQAVGETGARFGRRVRRSDAQSRPISPAVPASTGHVLECGSRRR
jgi:hypothetical protein